MKDTLVIWGGEFGGMPIAQMENGLESAGRDHNPSRVHAMDGGSGDQIGYRSRQHR